MDAQHSGSNRPPTLQDVADRAGVSRALVSIVMRDVPGAGAQTRQRVLAVAAELGYRPDSRARLLAGRRTRLLGVTLALHNPFHADLAESIYAAAETAGYEVVLSAITASRSPAHALDSLLSYRCEAVLLLGALVPRTTLRSVAGRLPVVVVGQPVRQPGADPAVDVVRVAGDAGMRLAVDHLVDLGHRRIVHVDGATSPAAAERRRGYQSAMRWHRLTGAAKVVTGGDREEDGAAAAERIVRRGLPDAVLTYNDRSAVGLLDVFARTGVSVPGDVSVVGYDDSQVARLPYLQLTTISQDVPALAGYAVQRALDRLAGTPIPGRQLVLPPHLVVRGTTAVRTR
ncbi:MAG: LacI family DNA-binding transcriptional regulator [Jatrophihabitans sp.]